MMITSPGRSIEWPNQDTRRQDAVFYSCWDAPFEVRGLCDEAMEQQAFYRLPAGVRAGINEGAADLSTNTAGACVRFMTDSPYVAIAARVAPWGVHHHFTVRGLTGLDIYAGPRGQHIYRTTAVPMEAGQQQAYALAHTPQGGALIAWTVYLPNYGGLETLHIGLKEGCRLEAPTPYTYDAPVVFYGSSITQGGCATRPGLAYTHVLGRWLDAGIVNLGFSGSALGEEAIARYISRMKMSCFVMDYDHNAPNAQHLAKTHLPFFNLVRAAQPGLPIVLVTKPDFEGDADGAQRRAIVYDTFEAARARGDQRVWFVDGEHLFGRQDRDACTVDGCHPNDLGFMRMASCIRPMLETALKAQVARV
nr:SGNH/GDSL hydrolase family protein [bacterium]